MVDTTQNGYLKSFVGPLALITERESLSVILWTSVGVTILTMLRKRVASVRAAAGIDDQVKKQWLDSAQNCLGQC